MTLMWDHLLKARVLLLATPLAALTATALAILPHASVTQIAPKAPWDAAVTSQTHVHLFLRFNRPT
jgi:hypothetical protein